MIQVGDMKFIDFEETLDRDFGPVGTPRRDEFERNVDESVHAYKLGEAIRQARISQNLTQEQLGKKVGVQKAQISRLERGKSISLSNITRIFKAMGIPLTLEMGNIGKVALW
ncbi:MAG: helix-turn-helix transcriptional regulator [Prevotella sp.]|nr:helix-turn-helix transcriptional regulator [Prevotella sp.]